VPERPNRAAEIEITEGSDGFVVYDPARDRVHYLNATASIVLELCTGENTESDIAHLLESCYDLPKPPSREVGDCLKQLSEEGLII